MRNVVSSVSVIAMSLALPLSSDNELSNSGGRPAGRYHPHHRRATDEGKLPLTRYARAVVTVK